MLLSLVFNLRLFMVPAHLQHLLLLRNLCLMVFCALLTSACIVNFLKLSILDHHHSVGKVWPYGVLSKTIQDQKGKLLTFVPGWHMHIMTILVNLDVLHKYAPYWIDKIVCCYQLQLLTIRILDLLNVEEAHLLSKETDPGIKAI